ncbi:IucA/IucC family protein [Silvanigrella sp.]|jgi:siderophore synthetase component|uniref:IucA/IucC family protein n=1 Tax=Silvanigrella sp. TaxID=2024976 RepID=UPI0037C92B46
MFEQIAKLAILSRLFQSIIREKIIKKESISFLSNDKIEIHISPKLKLIAFIKSFFSFERFDLVKNLYLENSGIVSEISHPNDLLDLIKEQWLQENENSVNSFDQFQIEIQNSVSNMILAQMSFEMNKSSFENDKIEYGINNSFDWVLKQKEKNKKFSSLSFYEQSVLNGHPVHPGSKTRMGMNLEDLIQYSPEWRKIVSLKLVAIDKKYSKVTMDKNGYLCDILFEDYPGLEEKFKLEMKDKGLNYEFYDLIPVHPWQLKKTIHQIFPDQLKDKKIIPINSFEIKARSLISFRSFAPESLEINNSHHIKTSINLLTTSDVRTISPRATQSGPLISHILNSIQNNLKEFMEGKFKIQSEIAGIYYNEHSDKYSKLEKAKLGQNLSCILRDNPENYVKNQGICMPAAALLERSPLSNKIILNEIIDIYKKEKYFNSEIDGAISFFKKYIDLSIPPLLTLMSKYGISLEAHMQNSMVAFRNGEPILLIVRDFSDIRISEERLLKHNYFINLDIQNSMIFCKNISVLHKNIFYSFFQSHIGEIIITLNREFGIEEKLLWKIVKNKCSDTFNELKKEPDFKEQIEEDEYELFKENIQLKALTKMRLMGEMCEYYFVDIKNPLNGIE